MKYFGCLYAIGLRVMATGVKDNSADSRVRTLGFGRQRFVQWMNIDVLVEMECFEAL